MPRARAGVRATLARQEVCDVREWQQLRGRVPGVPGAAAVDIRAAVPVTSRAVTYREAPALAARCAGWWWLAAVGAAWLWARSPVPCLIWFGVGASFLASAWYRCWLAFAWLEVQ